MTVVWLVLAILGATALLVLITSRFGKPMPQEKMAKLAPVLWVLILIMLSAQLLRYYLG
jgi:hypothetical protein